jgi:hypothetical protein
MTHLKVTFTDGDAVHELNLGALAPTQQPPPTIPPPGHNGYFPPPPPFSTWNIGTLFITFYQSGVIVISVGGPQAYVIITVNPADIAWLFSTDAT